MPHLQIKPKTTRYLFSPFRFQLSLNIVSDLLNTTLIAITGPRAYHGTVCIGHVIYIVGGFDGVEYFNSVRAYYPVTKSWAEVAPMNAKRLFVSNNLDSLMSVIRN